MDAVLLAAWAEFEGSSCVLDIGAGTGVMSLILAQRLPLAQISCVEIDDGGFTECNDNAMRSTFSNRIKCFHSDIRTFSAATSFDAVICNPPYFEKSLKSPSTGRNRARHTESLSFEEVIQHAMRLGSEQLRVAMITPFTAHTGFLDLIRLNNLKLQRLCHVRGNPDKPFKRSMIQFGMKSDTPLISDLTIEHERHRYTDEYVQLVRDFYIKL